MHKSQIALGERWKWHFQASRFQNFLGEHAQTPLALVNESVKDTREMMRHLNVYVKQQIL